jgi:hypothetical protein
MNNYKNLYKLIDGLNNKIKILESDVSNLAEKNKLIKNKSIKNIGLNDYIDNNINNQVKNEIKSKIESYKILSPTNFVTTKKYIGLMFDNNFNNFETDENSGGKNLLSFIPIPKSNIVINYFIQLELNYTPLTSVICSLALGIRSKSDSKIKIIKGTRQIFDVSSSIVVSGTINLTGNSIYMCGGDEELCMIGDLGSICKVNPKKSLIKLLYFY